MCKGGVGPSAAISRLVAQSSPALLHRRHIRVLLGQRLVGRAAGAGLNLRRTDLDARPVIGPASPIFFFIYAAHKFAPLICASPSRALPTASPALIFIRAALASPDLRTMGRNRGRILQKW